MKKVWIFFLVLAVISACTDDDIDGNVEPEVQHVSVISNTSNWESIAFSKDIFSGRTGYSFESEIKLYNGGVKDGSPTFMAKHQFRRSGGFEEYDKLHVVSGNELLNYSLPSNLGNESSSQIPSSIQSEFSNGGIDAIQNRYFRSGSDLWSQGNLIDERFNTTYPVYAATLLKNEDDIYGWMNRMLYLDFPNGYVLPGNDTSTDYVSFSNIGRLDLVETASQKEIYFMADFSNTANNPSQQRGLICKKTFSGSSKEVEQVAILPASSSLANEDYPDYYTIAFDEDNIYGIFRGVTADKVEIFYGGMNTEFKLQHTIDADIYRFQIIKGSSEFYIIYRIRNVDGYQAIKFDASGIVTNLGNIPYGTYGVWQGNLLIGTQNDSNEIEIIKISSAGNQEYLARGGDISFGDDTGLVLSEAFCFASNETELFVAVQNWKSPKYKGNPNQFGGWEIIKYKK